MNDNPLLDFSGLPRFDAHRARARDAGGRRAARATRARPIERVAADPRPPTWDERRRADRRRARPARSRVERGAPPQRGRQHAGAARRLQRQPAEGHGVLHRPRRRTSACTRSTARSPRPPAFAALDAGAAQGRRQRAARLPPRRRRAAATRERRASRPCRRSSRSCRRSSTTTCSTRPTPGRSTSRIARALAGVPDDVVRAGARRGGGRGPRRLQADAAHAVLHAR